MNLKSLLLIIALFSISCEPSQKEESEMNNKEEVLTPDIDRKPYTFNHSIAGNPFLDNKLTIESLYEKYGKGIELDKTPIENRHNPGQMDTIIILEIKNSVFEFYKTDSKALLKSAVVEDEEFRLKNNIKVGMKKDEFMEKFHEIIDSSNIPSVVEITSGEGESTLKFTFAGDILREIDYSPYLD